MNDTAFGLDLAGFSTGKSGLAKAQLIAANKIQVSVLRNHPFAKSRKGSAKIEDVVDIEVSLLSQFLHEGKVLIDMPLDLQKLGIPESAKMLWQLTKRPVDYVFDGLPPLADKIGSPVARAQIILKQLANLNPNLCRFGDNLFETYPAGSLGLIGLPRMGYKGKPIVFEQGKWRGEELATIANGLNMKSDNGTSLNDDDVDAIICAITGLVDGDCVLEGAQLESEIADRLELALPPSSPSVQAIPPNGYRLLKGLGPIDEILVTEETWQPS